MENGRLIRKPINKTCMGCKWLKDSGQNNNYICVRNPPSIHEQVAVHPISKETMVGYLTLYPVVKPDTTIRCGCFEGKIQGA